jgi:hypothetical protein
MLNFECLAYHCLFYLDYYLTSEPEKFSPPAPYGFSEFDSDGAMPERTYSKKELLGIYSMEEKNAIS